MNQQAAFAFDADERRDEEIAVDAYFATEGRWCRAGDEEERRFYMLSCAVCGGVLDDSPGPWHLIDAGRRWHCSRTGCVLAVADDAADASRAIAHTEVAP